MNHAIERFLLNENGSVLVQLNKGSIYSDHKMFGGYHHNSNEHILLVLHLLIQQFLKEPELVSVESCWNNCFYQIFLGDLNVSETQLKSKCHWKCDLILNLML